MSGKGSYNTVRTNLMKPLISDSLEEITLARILDTIDGPEQLRAFLFFV